MHKAISFVHVFKFIFENHYIIPEMKKGLLKLHRVVSVVVIAVSVLVLVPFTGDPIREHVLPGLMCGLYFFDRFVLIVVSLAVMNLAVFVGLLFAVFYAVYVLAQRRTGKDFRGTKTFGAFVFAGRVFAGLIVFMAWVVALTTIVVGLTVTPVYATVSIVLLSAGAAVACGIAKLKNISFRFRGAYLAGPGIIAVLSFLIFVVSGGAGYDNAVFAVAAPVMFALLFARRSGGHPVADRLFGGAGGPVCVALIVCSVTCLALAGEFLTGRPDPGLKRIGDAVKIYDLAYDRDSARLYFTSEKNDSFGYYDVRGGGSRVIEGVTRPERIALFPGRGLAFVAGAGGIHEFTVEPFERIGTIYETSTVDVQAVGGRYLVAVLSDLNSEVVLFDLDDPGRKPVDAGKASRLSYAVELTRAGDLYVGGWMISPFIFQTTFDGLVSGRGIIRKKYSRFMNMDMCVLEGAGRLLVAHPLNHGVDVLDAGSLGMIREERIPTGFGAREIECDARRGLLFSQNYFSGDVFVYDMGRKEMRNSYRTGPEIKAMEYDPETGVLYTGSRAGIFAIDAPVGYDQ